MFAIIAEGAITFKAFWERRKSSARPGSSGADQTQSATEADADRF